MQPTSSVLYRKHLLISVMLLFCREPATRSIIELPDAVASNFLLEAAERMSQERSQRRMRSH